MTVEWRGAAWRRKWAWALADGVQAVGASTWTTISFEKVESETGPSIWVYLIRADGKKQPLREVTWCFGNDAENWNVGIAAYVARPNKDGAEPLEAQFKDLEVTFESFKQDIWYDEETQPE